MNYFQNYFIEHTFLRQCIFLGNHGCQSNYPQFHNLHHCHYICHSDHHHYWDLNFPGSKYWVIGIICVVILIVYIAILIIIIIIIITINIIILIITVKGKVLAF